MPLPLRDVLYGLDVLTVESDTLMLSLMNDNYVIDIVQLSGIYGSKPLSPRTRFVYIARKQGLFSLSVYRKQGLFSLPLNLPQKYKG